THSNTDTHTHTHFSSGTHTHTHTHFSSDTHTHSHTHTHTHTAITTVVSVKIVWFMKTHAKVCAQSLVAPWVESITHTHTHTHTHSHYHSCFSKDCLVHADACKGLGTMPGGALGTELQKPTTTK